MHREESALFRLVFAPRFFASKRNLARRMFDSVLLSSGLAIALVCFACPQAHASVGVVLNALLNSLIDRITGTSHGVMYFFADLPGHDFLAVPLTNYGIHLKRC